MSTPRSAQEHKPLPAPVLRSLGIDVSLFDNSIDWETAKRVGTTPPGPRRVARSGKGTTHHNTLAIHGIDFAYIRASDPNHSNGRHSKVPHGVDPKFHTYWPDARAAGVIRGPYHLFRPNLAVAAQVELFVNTVGALEPDDLPPMFDLEVTGDQANEVIIERSQEWLQAVERHYGRKPVIYTSPSFWNDHMLGEHHARKRHPRAHHPGHHRHAETRPAGQDEHHSDGPGQDPHPSQDLFSQYPLFVANYGRSHPQLPRETWQDWTFWQYTETGTVQGVHKKGVDCDVFNGTLDQLKEFIKRSITAGPGVGRGHEAAQPDRAGEPASPAGQEATPEKKPPPQAAPDDAKPDEFNRKSQEPVPPSTGPVDGSQTYTVRSGDTLDALAQKFSVSAEALASANNISNPNLIRVGQVLTIP